MNFKNQYYVDICSESGAIKLREEFFTELAAHQHFERLESIKHPATYKGYSMNLSEWNNAGTVGYVRVVVINHHGELIRRELFRKA